MTESDGLGALPSASCILAHSVFVTTTSLDVLQPSLRDEDMDVQNGQVICPGPQSTGRVLQASNLGSSVPGPTRWSPGSAVARKTSLWMHTTVDTGEEQGGL